MKPFFCVFANVNINLVNANYFHKIVIKFNPFGCFFCYLNLNKIWLASVLLFFADSSVILGKSYERGTAIIIIRTDTIIVIATDSKVADRNNVSKLGHTCKIRKFGNVFYSLSGFVGEPLFGYDAIAIIDSVAKTRGTIESRISTLEQIIKPIIEKMLSDSISYRNDYETAPLGIIIFGVENKKFVIRSIRFPVDYINITGMSAQITIERKICPGSDCPENIAANFVSPDKSFSESFRQRYFRRGIIDYVGIAKLFVKMQIDRGIIDQDSHINILKITKSKGVEWVKRESECRE